MNKEEMLLEALNRYGNFTTVTQEFNENQLEVIYELMDMVEEHTKVNGADTSQDKALHKHGVTNRTCSFCGGTEFETTESQYNDVDNDYDRCEITYCTKCRNTHSIDI